MPLRLGYKASAEQFGPVELADFAVDAEQAGFDSVFISDHLQPWRHDGGHAPAALPWLGRSAPGPSGCCSAPRCSPRPSATTRPSSRRPSPRSACMYPGRVILGVGSGESLNEVPLGLEWPDGKERFARLKEAVTLIKELWTGERVDLRRHLLPHRQGHHLRPARRAGADLHRRVRPGGDQAGRPDRRRLHHHLRQGADRCTRTPCCRRWPRAPARPAARWTTSTC